MDPALGAFPTVLPELTPPARGAPGPSYWGRKEVRRGEKGGEGARRGGASERCCRVSRRPPRPSAGEVGARWSARQRAGRVGTREGGILREPRRTRSTPAAGAGCGAGSAEPAAGRRPPLGAGASPGTAARPAEGAPGHGTLAQRPRDGGGGGGGGGRPPGGVLVQRGGGTSPREEGPPARRHPLHALPRGRHLPLPQHFRAGTGDIRLSFHRAVWGPHRPPRQARVLRLLAEHRRSPHPDPHGHRHGGLDHEHLLGHGHGHPCQLQGAGHPTAAVSPQEPAAESRATKTFTCSLLLFSDLGWKGAILKNIIYCENTSAFLGRL